MQETGKRRKHNWSERINEGERSDKSVKDFGHEKDLYKSDLYRMRRKLEVTSNKQLVRYLNYIFTVIPKMKDSDNLKELLPMYIDHEKLKEFAANQIPSLLDGRLLEIYGSIKYYFANGQRIAQDSSKEELSYYHADHLGFAVMMTDTEGEIIMTAAYSAFGELLYQSDGSGTNYLFTGQEYDARTGLYYYGVRYYDPWLTASIR